MTNIQYDVPLIKQGVQECVQSSAAELLQYYGKSKTLEEVKVEVPVYITKEGVNLGTSLGHIATYFITQGFKTTLHTGDLQIFDRSWKNLSSEELEESLRKRQQYIKHPVYDVTVFEQIFDGYCLFLRSGGRVDFPIFDEEYLVELLKDGPYFAVVSYNFLNQTSKYAIEEGKAVHDAVKGNPSTHAVVVAGYKDGKFLINDPDFEFGGKRWIDANVFLGALYLAQTDYDCVVISLHGSNTYTD